MPEPNCRHLLVEHGGSLWGKERPLAHDRTSGRQLASTNHVDRPPAPASLSAMLAAAETLGRGKCFLRVDFYEVDGHPWFGEFCLYPGSGFNPFAADLIDLGLGALWRGAMPG